MTRWLKKMTEDQWLAQVTDLAHALDWYDYHVDRSAKRVVRRSGLMVWATNVSRQGKGFPDLVLVRERDARLVFAELKADDGRTTPEQDEWLRRLRVVADAVEELVAERDGKVIESLSWLDDARVELAKPEYARPRIEVALWRPRDYELVERTLR